MSPLESVDSLSKKDMRTLRIKPHLYCKLGATSDWRTDVIFDHVHHMVETSSTYARSSS
jgi:hypothetical protein